VEARKNEPSLGGNGVTVDASRIFGKGVLHFANDGKGFVKAAEVAKDIGGAQHGTVIGGETCQGE
jgi:hypothetical protein